MIHLEGNMRQWFREEITIDMDLLLDSFFKLQIKTK